MELLKLAIRYYIKVTGKTCLDFYNNLREVVATDITSQTGDDWLRHKLLERVITNSYTLDDVESAQDTMSTYFIETYVSNVQEYSVEPVWGKEVIKSVSKYLDIGSTVFWDIHSLSDTLFSGSKLDTQNVFLSHGNAQVVASRKVKKGITYFKFDFVNDFDFDKLPEKLQDTIKHDKPLVLLCNLPVKKEDLKTDVSDLMYADGFTTQNLNIHYQYLYKMVKFVEQYNLTNCYVGFFGDTALYTDNTNNVFLKYFRDTFDFKEGFCFSLKDFNSTINGVESLHFSLWSSEGIAENKPILLTKKRLISKTKVEDGEDILFEENRVSVYDWLQPNDVLFYKQAPIMLNYATFKGGEKFNKTAKFSNKIAENALGTMTVTKTMQDIKNILLLSGTPSSKLYVNITEENFWRCVAYFAFSVLVTPTWNNNKLSISAPNVKVEGYDKWCKNAVLLFLLDNKSMFSCLRNVQWDGVNTTIDNKLFFVDKELIEMATTDSLITKQLEDTPSNDFVIKQLQMARTEWTTETAQLYEFCLDFVQRTLDQRKLVRYAEDTDAWNAGFSQIKSVFGQSDMIFKTNYDRLYTKYVDSLRADVSKFGFLQDR